VYIEKLKVFANLRASHTWVLSLQVWGHLLLLAPTVRSSRNEEWR